MVIHMREQLPFGEHIEFPWRREIFMQILRNGSPTVSTERKRGNNNCMNTNIRELQKLRLSGSYCG